MNHLSMDEIKRLNDRRGGKWFSPENMRFHRSRLGYRTELLKVGETFACNVFVSSERTWNSGRAYTVRLCLPNGEIENLSELDQFTSRDQAWRWFKRHTARITEIIASYDWLSCDPWGGPFANNNIYNLPPDLALLRRVWMIMRATEEK